MIAINSQKETRPKDHRGRTPHLLGLAPAEREVYERIPLRVGYMNHASFSLAATEEALFGRHASAVVVPAWSHFPEVPEDVPGNMPGRRVNLTGKEEANLFLKYNYAKYRLAKLIQAQERRRSMGRARQMVLWRRRALDSESSLVRANMALVLAMAKRTRIPNVEFSELISEGNMALLRSVEKFDVSRGFKFSTYACRAILKAFNRMATKTSRYHQHFPTEFDPELERSDHDVAQHEQQHEDSVDELREVLARNTACLSDLERTVVMERFALASGGKGSTLAEVGRMVGLTNERVRQIQNLALTKIRMVLSDDHVAA